VSTEQLVVVMLSTFTSVCFLGNKVGQLECLRLRWKERTTLRVERTRLLTELMHSGRFESVLPGGPAAALAAAPAAAVAAAPAPAAADLDPEFTLARNAPVIASAAGPSNGPQEPQGAFRGVCPACDRNVYSTDEGRIREGDRYYHLQCVKGVCGRCGQNVYGDQERGRDGAMYYHIECPL
jgi:hypothetical protein